MIFSQLPTDEWEAVDVPSWMGPEASGGDVLTSVPQHRRNWFHRSSHSHTDLRSAAET